MRDVLGLDVTDLSPDAVRRVVRAAGATVTDENEYTTDLRLIGVRMVERHIRTSGVHVRTSGAPQDGRAVFNFTDGRLVSVYISRQVGPPAEAEFERRFRELSAKQPQLEMRKDGFARFRDRGMRMQVDLSLVRDGARVDEWWQGLLVPCEAGSVASSGCPILSLPRKQYPVRVSGGILRKSKKVSFEGGEGGKVTIEVRTGVEASNTDPKLNPVPNMIQIDVSGCRNAHIIQLLARDKEVYLPACGWSDWRCRWDRLWNPPIYPDPDEKAWQLDNGLPRKDQRVQSAYYDQNGLNPAGQTSRADRASFLEVAYLTLFGGLATAKDEPVFYIADRPTFVDNYPKEDKSNKSRWRAVAQDYVICNCQLIAQVKWARISIWPHNPEEDEQYEDIDIVAPPPVDAINRLQRILEREKRYFEAVLFWQ
jgi:hypothetical protein